MVSVLVSVVVAIRAIAHIHSQITTGYRQELAPCAQGPQVSIGIEGTRRKKGVGGDSTTTTATTAAAVVTTTHHGLVKR